MARCTSETVAIERPVECGILGEGTRQHTDWIVATVAMAREFDSFCADQDVDAGSIKRGAKRIGMQSLAPFMVRLLMTMAAVRSIRKGTCLKKATAFKGCISR